MEQQIKIAYLSPSTLISDTANSIHVMRMSDALAGLGFEVELHALKGYGKSEQEVKNYYGADHDFRIQRHDPKANPITRVFRVLQSWLPIGPICRFLEGYLFVLPTLKANPPYAIFSRNVEWLLVCSKAAEKMIYETHQPPSNFFYKWLHGWLFKQMDLSAVVVISEALKIKYLDMYPFLNPDLLMVAHDGANPVNDSTLAITGKRLRLGYVGHLYSGRGLNLMLELASHFVDVELHIVGGDKPTVDLLRKSGAPSNVILYGHVSPSALSEIYAKLDVLLAPYQRNVSVAGGKGNTVNYMSPLKIFEYMSWGRPIVVSDLPVLREILENNRTALFAEPDSITDWVSKISLLKKSPSLRKSIGKNAQAEFLDRYTWSKRANTIISSVGKPN